MKVPHYRSLPKKYRFAAKTTLNTGLQLTEQETVAVLQTYEHLADSCKTEEEICAASDPLEFELEEEKLRERGSILRSVIGAGDHALRDDEGHSLEIKVAQPPLIIRVNDTCHLCTRRTWTHIAKDHG